MSSSILTSLRNIEALKSEKSKTKNTISKLPSTHPEDDLVRSLVDTANINNVDLKNNIKLKTEITYWTLIIVTFYIGFIGIKVGLTPNLSDSVLIALLTTTTINVLALPYLIIKELFK